MDSHDWLDLTHCNGMSPPEGTLVPTWSSHTTSFGKKVSTMKLIRVGGDFAKNVFQLHGIDRTDV